MVILYANYAVPCGAQMVSQTLFWMCLWRCFLSKFNIWICWLGKADCPFMWAGLIYSVEDLNKTKRLIPWVKRVFLLPVSLQAGTHTNFLIYIYIFNAYIIYIFFFLCLQAQIDTSVLPGPQTWWPSHWNYPIISPAWWLQIFGLVSLHNHVSRFQ